MNERKRKFALLGGLFGSIYLAANNLLPDKTAEKIRKWKRRGE